MLIFATKCLCACCLHSLVYTFSRLSGEGRQILGKLLSFFSFSFACSPASSSTASSGWQCSLPDLNREFRVAVFPAGPQLRVPLGSVPRRTSTASFGWQCSPPDLNRELRLAVFPAGPRPRVPPSSVHICRVCKPMTDVM